MSEKGLGDTSLYSPPSPLCGKGDSGSEKSLAQGHTMLRGRQASQDSPPKSFSGGVKCAACVPSASAGGHSDYSQTGNEAVLGEPGVS